MSDGTAPLRGNNRHGKYDSHLTFRLSRRDCNLCQSRPKTDAFSTTSRFHPPTPPRPQC